MLATLLWAALLTLLWWRYRLTTADLGRLVLLVSTLSILFGLLGSTFRVASLAGSLGLFAISLVAVLIVANQRGLRSRTLPALGVWGAFAILPLAMIAPLVPSDDRLLHILGWGYDNNRHLELFKEVRDAGGFWDMPNTGMLDLVLNSYPRGAHMAWSLLLPVEFGTIEQLVRGFAIGWVVNSLTLALLLATVTWSLLPSATAWAPILFSTSVVVIGVFAGPWSSMIVSGFVTQNWAMVLVLASVLALGDSRHTRLANLLGACILICLNFWFIYTLLIPAALGISCAVLGARLWAGRRVFAGRWVVSLLAILALLLPVLGALGIAGPRLPNYLTLLLQTAGGVQPIPVWSFVPPALIAMGLLVVVIDRPIRVPFLGAISSLALLTWGAWYFSLTQYGAVSYAAVKSAYSLQLLCLPPLAAGLVGVVQDRPKRVLVPSLLAFSMAFVAIILPAVRPLPVFTTPFQGTAWRALPELTSESSYRGVPVCGPVIREAAKRQSQVGAWATVVFDGGVTSVLESRWVSLALADSQPDGQIFVEELIYQVAFQTTREEARKVAAEFAAVRGPVLWVDAQPPLQPDPERLPNVVDTVLTCPEASSSDVPGPPPVVSDWGPRTTLPGTSVNPQPQGGSGIWVKVDLESSLGTTVQFGDQGVVDAVIVPGLLTFRVPDSWIAEPGSYPIVVVERGGRRIPVGDFVVAA